MIEPTIWMQLGISDDRYYVLLQEVTGILRTKETIGKMMLMVQANTKLSVDERYYAVFLIAREDIKRRLMKSVPAIGKGMIGKILEE